MQGQDKLVILWTSGDPVTAEKMVFMYAENALKKAWWKEVTLLIWGASTALVKENPRIAEHIQELVECGVEICACKACADSLEAGSILEGLGVEVKYTGETLTEYLKLDYKLLTI